MKSRDAGALGRIVPAFAPWVIRGLMGTCSLRILNRKIKEEYVDGGRPFVAVIWHHCMLIHIDTFRRRGIVTLSSRSRDGEISARTMQKYGFFVVRGSSSSGGAGALKELATLVRGGRMCGIISDGPRGPARVSKTGCVVLAREAGVPLIPIACHAEPAFRLRSWDRTLIPRPFARIVYAFGDPIVVPADADRDECERIRERLDARMEEQEAACRQASARG